MLMSTRGTAGQMSGLGRRMGESVTVLAALILTCAALVCLAGPAAAAPDLVAAAAPDLVAAVCPVAPPGTEEFANEVTGWVKWGAIWLLGISAVVSICAIAGGRIFQHPHASRAGAIGISWSIAGAILYGVILVIIDSIVGSGCT